MKEPMKVCGELDTLVAKVVMGYRVKDYGDNCYYYSAPDKTCGPHCRQHWHMMPPYSRDMHYAWEVVGRLRVLFPSARINLLGTNDEAQGPGNVWGFSMVQNWGQGSMEVLVDVKASTAAHAICLGALEAMEARNAKTGT